MHLQFASHFSSSNQRRQRKKEQKDSSHDDDCNVMKMMINAIITSIPCFPSPPITQSINGINCNLLLLFSLGPPATHATTLDSPALQSQ